MLHPLLPGSYPRVTIPGRALKPRRIRSVVGAIGGVRVPRPEERRSTDDHDGDADTEREASVGTAMADGLDRLIRDVLRGAVADLGVTLRRRYREEAQDERHNDRNEEEQRQLHAA